jgi:hypothetical protein
LRTIVTSEPQRVRIAPTDHQPPTSACITHGTFGAKHGGQTKENKQKKTDNDNEQEKQWHLRQPAAQPLVLALHATQGQRLRRQLLLGLAA